MSGPTMSNLFEPAYNNWINSCECRGMGERQLCMNTPTHLVTSAEGSGWMCEVCISHCLGRTDQYVVDGHTDLIVCSCGNRPDLEGFGTCTPTGIWCDDHTGRTPSLVWDGLHHRCAKCNFVFTIPPEHVNNAY